MALLAGGSQDKQKSEIALVSGDLWGQSGDVA